MGLQFLDFSVCAAFHFSTLTSKDHLTYFGGGVEAGYPLVVCMNQKTICISKALKKGGGLVETQQGKQCIVEGGKQGKQQPAGLNRQP